MNPPAPLCLCQVFSTPTPATTGYVPLQTGSVSFLPDLGRPEQDWSRVCWGASPLSLRPQRVHGLLSWETARLPFPWLLMASRGLVQAALQRCHQSMQNHNTVTKQTPVRMVEICNADTPGAGEHGNNTNLIAHQEYNVVQPSERVESFIQHGTCSSMWRRSHAPWCLSKGDEAVSSQPMRGYLQQLFHNFHRSSFTGL